MSIETNNNKINKVNKTITSIDNPSIKKNTTRKIGSINFSKSNFVGLGKWVLIIVLFLYFGSYTINGFVASNITKDSTEETIVHEYKKIIGYEQPSGYFDFIESFEDLSYLVGKKIYFKELYNGYVISELLATYKPSNIYGNFFEGSSVDGTANIIFYDSNDVRVNSASRLGQIQLYSDFIGNSKYRSYRNSNDFTLYDVSYYSTSSSTYSYFILKNYKIPTGSYLINDIYVYRDYLNYFFYLDDNLEPIPIYETITYTYDIKDINYNWDYKLMQISKFRPLFNSKDLFVNEDFYKYSSLITYEFKNTDKEKENVVNKYKDDERLKILFDNESITIKGREYNFHLIKAKKDYISYINFDYTKIDMFNVDVYNAYIYALENYVTNINIDDYFIYSKMKFDYKDLLIIFSFPIQIVINTAYNFGVLVGIVTLW